MNWAEYSRFMGDIFWCPHLPLKLNNFLGIYVYGRLDLWLGSAYPKPAHLGCHQPFSCTVGANLSAFYGSC
ncbi:MAG: hypothetical protein ACLTJ8_03960 [Veillonella atypica]